MLFIIIVNLDLLLTLLKKEIIPRWHEFGALIGVPKEVIDNYLKSEYTADQCILEIFDYWLRHHPGPLTWNNVAQKLNEMKLHHLAEKALQISVTGKFCQLHVVSDKSGAYSFFYL